MQEQTFMALMRLLPKSALSSVMGAASRSKAPRAVHQAAIRAFVSRYRVDVSEAEHPLEHYATFAEFFCRGLKAGARPIAPGETVVVSPVDGAVSQAGCAVSGQCVQAKGISFPVADLLGDPAEARPFEKGAFATLYLSPRDYHRIHAPLDGRIVGYRYLPGELWPVNAASVKATRALFCLNERLVTYLETAAGQLALIAVGATGVGRIQAAYDSITTHRKEAARHERYGSPIKIAKGQELARFELGSTVILLFEDGKVRWEASLREGAPVRMGQKIGEAT